MANTTNSTELYGWTWEPEMRGTFGIITSCLFVVFVSTWTVLHLNCPAPDDPWQTTCTRKIRWALLAIFTPEAVTTFAAPQWYEARASIKPMHDIGITHWTIVHGFYAVSGGFMLHAPDIPPFPVNSRAIHYLVERGYLSPPTITKRDILDRSKADIFAKMTAIVQVGWLVIQCIARKAKSLVISLPEIVTLGFAVVTFTTYFFWMDKPMDVEGHTALHTSTPLSVILRNAGEAAKKPYVTTPMDFLDDRTLAWARIPSFRNFGGASHRPLRRFPNDHISPHTDLKLNIFYPLVGVLHCTVHFLGWNFRFPTRYELYLWRAATVYLLIGPIGFGVLVLLMHKPGLDLTVTIFFVWQRRTSKNKSWVRRWVLNAVSLLASFLYFAARLTVLGLAGSSLRKTPSSVYQTVDWANYILHV